MLSLSGVMHVIIGTILNAGVSCPDLRLDDGQVVKLSGVPSHVRTGDRLSITGVTTHSMACQRTVFATVEVRVLSSGGRPLPEPPRNTPTGLPPAILFPGEPR